MLLEAGADDSKPTDDGSSPLLAACAHGHLHVIQLLLVAGADMKLGRHNGDTPLAIASRHGHLEIVQKLAEEQPYKKAKLS